MKKLSIENCMLKMMRLLLIPLTTLLMACGEKYYTPGDFTKVKKIDTHTHHNAESTALADLAREDNFLLLTVNVDVPDYLRLEEQQRLALLQKQQNPGRIEFLSAFSLNDWDAPGWEEATIRKLKTAFDSGALGIKLWKNIGMVYKNASGEFIMVDDPKLDNIIQFVIDQDKTVMAHIGEPKNCWLPLEEMTVNNDRNYFKEHPQYHMYLHPDYPSYETIINARDHFLEKHPDMRFVGAHLGSLEWNVDELARRLDRFPNMAVDMAARICHLQYQSMRDYDKVRNFFIKYQDRLIYATDSGISKDSDPERVKKNVHATWLEDWKYFVTDEEMEADEVNGKFRGLKLPKEVVDKIYYHNAVRWFKIAERR
jgi:predicted TIM-barrel fold metal-dependent hydrolase